jgi:hypothetical protein
MRDSQTSILLWEHARDNRFFHLIVPEEMLALAHRNGTTRDRTQTSNTPTAVARKSTLSFCLRTASWPIYSPCMMSSRRASMPVAASRRSHSSPFVSGTGIYGVKTMSGRRTAAAGGSKRRHYKNIKSLLKVLQVNSKGTLTLSVVGAFDARAISMSNLVKA